MRRVSKVDQFKKAKQAERKMYASKIDWYLTQMEEARTADNQHEVSRCDAVINDCLLQMHKLKKFV
jgi:hypothetical protein